jgi:hypothetical protein
MNGEGNCHEAAARHYELAAQHLRLAAQRAAGGDAREAAHFVHVAKEHAAQGHRYAIRASMLPLPVGGAGDEIDEDYRMSPW